MIEDKVDVAIGPGALEQLLKTRREEKWEFVALTALPGAGTGNPGLTEYTVVFKRQKRGTIDA